MGRRNFNPQSQQFNERQIVRENKSFLGMYEDAVTIPNGAMRHLENYVAFKNRIEPRAGTRLWSTVKRPVKRTSVSLGAKASTPDSQRR
jgi:hypothetical protein